MNDTTRVDHNNRNVYTMTKVDMLSREKKHAPYANSKVLLHLVALIIINFY